MQRKREQLVIPAFILFLVIMLESLYPQSQKKELLIDINQKIEQKKNWILLSQPEYFIDEEINQLSEDIIDYFDEYGVETASRLRCLFSRDSLIITLKIFQLPNHIYAFGFYAVNKSPSLDFFNIGFETYAIGQRLVCWYGNYVVFAEKEDTIQTRIRRLRDFTEEVVKLIPRQKRKTPILDCLPEKNRVEHSEKFYVGNWLGQDYFNHIYYADYNTGEGYSRIFIINNILTAAADSSFWNYFYFFQENIGIIRDTLDIDTDYYVVNEPLWGRTILAKKNHIIYGILDYRNEDWTEDRLAEVLDALKKRQIVKPG
ncbi:MAG: hypothetical protein JSW33_05720 [bacterium]|nr:MAG: hypothetical protein JSW33_05720 [bacterium]